MEFNNKDTILFFWCFLCCQCIYWTKWILLEAVTLWEFSCCCCAADCRFQELISLCGIIEMWFVRIAKTVVGILSQYLDVWVEMRRWWFSSVFIEHLRVVLWWTDLPGGWLDTCADFQRSWFWWMFWSKMGSDQISVEVTVVVSILDAGVLVLLLQKVVLILCGDEILLLVIIIH